MINWLLGSIATLTLLAWHSNRHRAKRFWTKELRPNCLLTVNPLVFISSSRSFFYFNNYWNLIPSLLAEHGYTVYHIQLAKLQDIESQQQLENILKRTPHAHLFFSDLAKPIINELCLNNKIQVSSLTELENTLPREQASSLRPSRIATYSINTYSENSSTGIRASLLTAVMKYSLKAHNFLSKDKIDAQKCGYFVSETLELELLSHTQHLAELDFQKQEHSRASNQPNSAPANELN